MAPLILAGCGGLSEAMTAHTDVVARAAGKELKVDDAAQLMALNPQVPADPQVVQVLADYWVDYTLLASAVAEDSSLAAVNLNALVEPMKEQMIVTKLRDQVIHPDTTFTDAQVEQAWQEEGPGTEIHARHILLKVPADATPQQRDSVKQLAESLRQRALKGEDFATLATQYSQDPGSAKKGGDLGFFGRGRMVTQFEDAAFKLQPGQISPVVETPFGYHIIKVEGRRQQPIGSQAPQFRRYLVQQAEQKAEQTYLDSIAKASNIEVRPGAVEATRQIAKQPEQQLRGRAGERDLVTYNKGSLTTGDFLDFIRSQPPQAQSSIAQMSDDDVKQMLEQLTRKEVLLQQARARNIGVSKAEEDSIRNNTRRAIHQLVEQTGFGGLAGEGSKAPVQSTVQHALSQLVLGQAQLPQLGPFGYALRDVYPAEVNQGTFPQVVERLKKIRASQPQNPQQPAGPAAADTQSAPRPAAPAAPAAPADSAQ
ncbi:MAG TPA: peptidylprolyl isomerase [Longimicrobiaceae bacterium]|nr:peptidylprolyl isomerase [Longimicrobiaceae bacterium]